MHAEYAYEKRSGQLGILWIVCIKEGMLQVVVGDLITKDIFAIFLPNLYQYRNSYMGKARWAFDWLHSQLHVGMP